MWLILALASAAFLGGYEIARKAALRDGDVLLVLLTATAGGMIVLLPLAVIPPSPVVRQWGLVLEPLGLRAHGLILVKSAVVSAAWVCGYFAVKHLPISVTSPLRATSPLVTLLGAMLLFAERPSPIQWVGIALILLGYLGFSILGRFEGIRFEANRWIALLVLGTLLGSSSGLYDKHLLQSEGLKPTTLQFWFTAYNLSIQSLLALVLSPRFSSQNGPAMATGLRTNPPGSGESMPTGNPAGSRKARLRTVSLAATVGVSLVAADQFYFRALADPEALVSMTSLARRSSVLISFSVGGLLFREKGLALKGLCVVVLLVGVALLFF